MRSKGLLNLASSSLPGRCREAAPETRARRVRGRDPPRRHDTSLRVRRGRLIGRAAPRFRAGLQGKARQSNTRFYLPNPIHFPFLITSSQERMSRLT